MLGTCLEGSGDIYDDGRWGSGWDSVGRIPCRPSSLGGGCGWGQRTCARAASTGLHSGGCWDTRQEERTQSPGEGWQAVRGESS